jgi:lipopolysaccharide transport system permease protein
MNVRPDNFSEDWDMVIRPKSKILDLRLKEVFQYKDLILLFVKRDLVAQYKQTILGPLWHIVQPLITTALYTVIFGMFAKLPTDGSPSSLFYLSGIVMWNFFAVCLSNTSNTFTSNASLFGKIYFPRLIVPISVIISNLIRFLIQFGIFVCFLIYYSATSDEVTIRLSSIAVLPILLTIMALMGLGFGIIISSLTTKYRDLSHFLVFGIQLLMYLTPVIYPSSFWGKYQWILKLNPLTSVMETFRYFFIGTGYFDMWGLIYSIAFAVIVFLAGAVLFNKVEKTFMDVV